MMLCSCDILRHPSNGLMMNGHVVKREESFAKSTSFINRQIVLKDNLMCVPCKIEPADRSVPSHNNLQWMERAHNPHRSVLCFSYLFVRSIEEEEKQTAASANSAENGTKSQSLAGSTHGSYSHPRYLHQTHTQTHLLLPFPSRSIPLINADAPVATTSVALSRMLLNHG